jgi:hypothetical protein
MQRGQESLPCSFPQFRLCFGGRLLCGLGKQWVSRNGGGMCRRLREPFSGLGLLRRVGHASIIH